MRIDLHDAIREALSVDVPEAPIRSIRSRADQMSRRQRVAGVASTLAIAFVACMCIGVNGNPPVSHGAAVARQAVRTPAPCPAPDPQMS
jgi:hypothetical protein